MFRSVLGVILNGIFWAMTDEQLAPWLIVYHDDYGEYSAPGGMYDSREEALENALEWLKMEVAND